MNRVRNAAMMVALAGLLVLSNHKPSHGAPADDMRGIEKLHQQDIAATLSQDPKALADLFDDDGVLLQPDEDAVVGRPAFLAENEKQKAQSPNMRILSYKPVIKDLQVSGNWAIEWDYFEASYKESENSEPKSFRAKALRVLKRQPDGSWKFARVMWNMAGH